LSDIWQYSFANLFTRQGLLSLPLWCSELQGHMILNLGLFKN